MIIEIGTSDFRTLAGKENGLFIEPVKEYFDRLPNCTKENVAISNYDGEINLYYIPSKVIEIESIPNWVRGCNSVNSIHPTILLYGWQNFVKGEVVKVVRIKSLIEKYDIKQIDVLKIDTEGHDSVILNDFLDTVDILPKTIQFECNVLSDTKEINKLLYRLERLNYSCNQVKDDYICRLK